MAFFKFRTRAVDSKGRYLVYLTLMHKRDARDIGTGLYIPSKKNLVDNKIVGIPEADIMNERLNYMMEICKFRISGLNTDKFSCMALKEYICKTMNNMSVKDNINTLGELFDCRIKRLRSDNKNSTADILDNTKTKVLDSLGDMSIHSIQAKNIKFLLSDLKCKGFNNGSINIVMKCLKSLLNWAMNEGFVVYEVFPFTGISMPQPAIVYKDLSPDDFVKLKNYPLIEGDLRFTRDMFLLSFYLGGMRMLDLRKVNLSSTHISYVSSKHSSIKKNLQVIEIDVPYEARAIINKYSAAGEFVWPKKLNSVSLDDFFRNRLKLLKKEIGITSPLTMYTPGKTFSQFAVSLDINKDVIKYVIGQNVDLQNPIYNYIKVIAGQSNSAIRKVIDYSLSLENGNPTIDVNDEFLKFAI